MKLKKICVFLFVLLLLSATAAGAYPRRIVSLTPVGTEMLFELGQEKHIIGVTDFCDYPPEALKKPKIGGYATINLEGLIAMKADLLVLSDLHLQFKKDLESLKIPHVFIMQEHISDIYKSISALGRACGQEKRAAEMNAKIKADLARVSQKTAKLPKKRTLLCVSRELSDERVSVFYAAGRKTFYNELIELAGGVNAVKETTSQYPKISVEGLIAIDPDVIIDVVGERTFYHSLEKIDLDKVFNKDYLKGQWKSSAKVKASANDQIYIFDGTVYLRPGPRIGVILLSFAKALHPEVKW